MIGPEIQKLLVMKRAFEIVKKRQKANISKISDLQERLDRLKVVRERYVGDSDIIEAAVGNLEDNGFKVELAENGKEAIELLHREINGERIVVKSKSNVTKEINLTRELELKGINVIETDIGDRLIQILNEEPSHPTGPAAHLSIDYIVNLINGRFEVELKKDPYAVIEFLMEDIRKYGDILSGLKS